MAQRRGSKGEDLQVKEGESWGYFRLRKVKMEEKDKKKNRLVWGGDEARPTRQDITFPGKQKTTN